MKNSNGKPLQKLSNKQIFDDVNVFIKSSHKFFSTRVPELKTMAKKLHEEHGLKDFYKVFNKLWKSGYEKEKSLAIYTLQMYKDDFDANTWKFLKPKLKNINDKDHIESIKEILKEIIGKYPKLRKEIEKEKCLKN